jgi:hypothetical protein
MRALLLLALLPLSALAAGVTVSWTHPTQNTDGTALALANIASTRVEYGSCSGTAFGTKAGEAVVPAPATTTTFDLAPGTYCFRAYSKTVAALGALESGPSGVASKVVPYSPPNPPVITVVNITAYEYIGPKGRNPARLGKVVGTVPLGTACGQSMLGAYYTVPREAVRFTRSTRQPVVAKCG